MRTDPYKITKQQISDIKELNKNVKMYNLHVYNKQL